MDDMLEDIASCGPFQTIILVVIRLQVVAAVWSNIMMMFGGHNPGWTCSTLTTAKGKDFHSEDSTESLISTRASVFWSARGLNETNFNTSVLFPLENGTDSLHKNRVIDSCGNESLCDAIEFGGSANTIVTHFSLICDREYVVALIILLTMTGTVAGCLFWGQIGERFGRKIACFGSTLILFLTNLVAIFSPSVHAYAVISLIAGIGSGGIFVTYIVYGYEFLNPRWRGIVGGIPCWNLSVAMFGGVVALLRDWRYIHLATCCFSGLSFLAVFWAPESIRWLHAHGKQKQLKATLQHVMKVNKRTGDVDDILEGLKPSQESPSQQIYSFLDLFRKRYIRIISVKGTIIMFLLSLFYFTLAFSLKTLSGNIYTNILVGGVIEIPFTLCTIPFVNTLGRRITTAMSMAGAGLCSLVIVVSLLLDIDSTTASEIFKYSSLVAKGFVIGSWSSMITLTQELFPTVIRNVGQGHLMLMSRAGAMLSPYLVPKNDDHDSFLVTYVSITVGFVFIVYLVKTLPETNKMPLEDWIGQSKKVSSENEAVNMTQSTSGGIA